MTKQSQHQKCIQYMHVLCKLGAVLAIVPPNCLSKERNKNKIPMLDKCYPLILIATMAATTGISIFCRFNEVYPLFPSFTLIITDIGVTFSTAISNMLAVLIPSLLYKDDFKLFFKILTARDTYFSRNELQAKTGKSFYVDLAVGHITLLILAIYDGYVWTTNLGFARFRHYIIRIVHNYHLYITILIISNFALLIENRVGSINGYLSTFIGTTEGKINNAENDPRTIDKPESYKAIRRLTRMYEKHMQQIKIFNNIFGWQILFTTLCTIMGLLNSLNKITVVLVMGYHTASGEILGYELEILSCFWTLWQLLLGAMVVISCNKAECEAKKTSNLCFSVLLTLPLISETSDEKAFRNELVLLNQLVINRCPSFSAAGFFPVNYSLLLAIFGVVTSNVIVLIQFTNQ